MSEYKPGYGCQACGMTGDEYTDHWTGKPCPGCTRTPATPVDWTKCTRTIEGLAVRNLRVDEDGDIEGVYTINGVDARAYWRASDGWLIASLLHPMNRLDATSALPTPATQAVEEDFLADLVAKRTAANPNFPALVEEAAKRRGAMTPELAKAIRAHDLRIIEGFDKKGRDTEERHTKERAAMKEAQAKVRERDAAIIEGLEPHDGAPITDYVSPAGRAKAEAVLRGAPDAEIKPWSELSLPEKFSDFKYCGCELGVYQHEHNCRAPVAACTCDGTQSIKACPKCSQEHPSKKYVAAWTPVVGERVLFHGPAMSDRKSVV